MITHNAHTGGTVTVIFDNNSKTLDKVECLSIYAEIVEHVQVKIAEFKEKGHANFKDECEKLITYIKQEKEKHKECYTKWSLDLNLDNYEDINGFFQKCNANTNCNFITPQYKELIGLKDDTKISCERDQDPVKNVIEPSQQQEISQNKQDIKSLETSGEPDLEKPEPKVSHPFRLSGPIENRNPSSHVAIIPSNNALGTNPSGTSTQSNPEGKSTSTGIHQERTSETIAALSDAHNSNPLSGTADVGVISASSDHTPSSVKSTIENDPPREGYVTKTADNAHNDSKGACDAVSDVEAKEDKAPCSDNPGKSGPCLVVDGGTSCSEVSSETSYIEESTCKTHIREINIDKNISSTYHDANNSLCARDLTSSDKNSLLHPNGQEIRGIQDSFASVCNSMVLQRDSSPQSDPHTRQETTGLVSQVQTEKTQNYEKSLQEPNSNMEHDTNIQNSPNQKDLQVSTQGSPHGNQETSGGAPNRANNDGETFGNLRNNPSAAGATGDAGTTGSDNILDMSNRFFSNMSYKEIIMMALVLLAIILLLTFLIKHTPLGTMFINKKKKQKKINEKLQRILSGYPELRDEINIPFSYSPFAYST